jgi:hypothetical protein
MNLIKRILGITDLLIKQEETNKILSELIRIGKHSIENNMKSHSDKQSYHSYR